MSSSPCNIDSYRLRDSDDFSNDDKHQPMPVFHGDDIISDNKMLENNVSNTNWNTYNIEREGGTSHNSAMSRDIKYNEADQYNSNNESNALNEDNYSSKFLHDMHQIHNKPESIGRVLDNNIPIHETLRDTVSSVSPVRAMGRRLLLGWKILDSECKKCRMQLMFDPTASTGLEDSTTTIIRICVSCGPDEEDTAEEAKKQAEKIQREAEASANLKVVEILQMIEKEKLKAAASEKARIKAEEEMEIEVEKWRTTEGSSQALQMAQEGYTDNEIDSSAGVSVNKRQEANHSLFEKEKKRQTLKEALSVIALSYEENNPQIVTNKSKHESNLHSDLGGIVKYRKQLEEDYMRAKREKVMIEKRQFEEENAKIKKVMMEKRQFEEENAKIKKILEKTRQLEKANAILADIVKTTPKMRAQLHEKEVGIGTGRKRFDEANVEIDRIVRENRQLEKANAILTDKVSVTTKKSALLSKEEVGTRVQLENIALEKMQLEVASAKVKKIAMENRQLEKTRKALSDMAKITTQKRLQLRMEEMNINY